MSSRSGGAIDKTKSVGVNDNYGGSRVDKSDEASSSSVKREDGDNECVPLESRTIEVRDSNGRVKQVPALDKRWAPQMNYIEFYLPSCQNLLEDEATLLTWLDYMDMYAKDLTWLLAAPHNQFWSVMVYSPEVPQVVLQSFLLRAPQWFDKEFEAYLLHEIIGPKYQEIYGLVFRVFLRLCTFKESKQDFITPITWASLLTDHKIIDVLKLQSICCLYDASNNAILPKMIENVMKNCPKLVTCFRNLIPVLLQKTTETTDELKARILESQTENKWDVEVYEEMLSFFLSTTCGLYKFAKVYAPVAEMMLKFPNALMKLAYTYEPNCCKVWNQVVSHLPMLEGRAMLLRILLIKLFRVGLANSTILQVTSSNDQRIDEYFEILTNCLDEKTFIRDYEKTFPFKEDINTLLSKGIFIDETRIDYVANAISSCFHACGENYAVEKIVVDPLYDPNFDRQLLGACSLDVTGPELSSLVTQVKDILPELPDSYVEVVLKHYGYEAEASINALLEGTVPSRLDKYKNEHSSADDRLPIIPDDPGEKFYAGKRKHGGDNPEKELEPGDASNGELNHKIKDLVKKMNQDLAVSANQDMEIRRNNKSVQNQSYEMEGSRREPYIDESLLPSYRDAEYDDEYDDTYDELGVGMTEPDNMEYKPLNVKKVQAAPVDDDEEDDAEEDTGRKKLDLYEDPAIVRARLERRRQEKMQHNNHHRRGPPPPSSNDVVGRAKGQGQDKDVVLARRQKTINKNSGGYNKKRADFKRREF